MEEPMKQQVNQMDQLRHQASNRLHFFFSYQRQQRQRFGPGVDHNISSKHFIRDYNDHLST